jgi:hypothetical protein
MEASKSKQKRVKTNNKSLSMLNPTDSTSDKGSSSDSQMDTPFAASDDELEPQQRLEDQNFTAASDSLSMVHAGSGQPRGSQHDQQIVVDNPAAATPDNEIVNLRKQNEELKTLLEQLLCKKGRTPGKIFGEPKSKKVVN